MNSKLAPHSPRRSPRARFLWLTASLACVFALATASQAQAAALQIQIAGLNLNYDGSSVFDAGVHNMARTGNPADADSLDVMNFLVDNVLVGSLTTDIFADIYISGVTNVPATGGSVFGNNVNSFGIDLFTSNNNPGWGLALNIDSFQFSYLEVFNTPIAITAAGLASSIPTQQLPFALEFDASLPVTIVLSSAQLTNVTDNGVVLTGLDASGTGNIAGTLVPEPGTVSLAGLGLIGLGGYALKRRRSRTA